MPGRTSRSESKGKLILIMPVEAEIGDYSFDSFSLPKGWGEVIDDEITVVYLPKGSLFAIGEAGVEALQDIRDRIDTLLGGT